MTQKKTTRIKRIFIILIALLALLAAGFFAYFLNYYHAVDTAALESDADVTVSSASYGWFFDGPGEDKALIFYPGAKVEETAYAPLLHLLASRGMDACLVKMPFRFAIFNSGAAADVMKQHSYDTWYIGGHSLGGAMAANYAAGHAEEYAGVILLAAYPTKRLPDSLKEVLIAGSEDRIVNRRRIEKARKQAPADYVEHEIVGGNHAQFGNYGAQKGDGEATISAEEQIEEAVGVILSET